MKIISNEPVEVCCDRYMYLPVTICDDTDEENEIFTLNFEYKEDEENNITLTGIDTRGVETKYPSFVETDSDNLEEILINLLIDIFEKNEINGDGSGIVDSIIDELNENGIY